MQQKDYVGFDPTGYTVQTPLAYIPCHALIRIHELMPICHRERMSSDLNQNECCFLSQICQDMLARTKAYD